MAGYDHYKDRNGVTWTVVWPAGKKRFEAIATVEPEADPKYDPEPPDITVSMAQGGVQFLGLEIIPSEQATGEQQRTLFTELVDKIQQYAKDHPRDLLLKVTPSKEEASSSKLWAWLLGLGVVAILARRGG